MSLTLRDKSKTKFKNGVVAALSIFALVVQPVVSLNVPNAFAAGPVSVSTYDAFKTALDNNEAEINIEGTIQVPQQININHSVTLRGGELQSSTDNNNTADKYADDSILYIGGDANTNVTVVSTIFDGNDKKNRQAVKVYDGAKATFSDVTFENAKKAGLHVNGASVVSVNNVTTKSNGGFFGGLVVSGSGTLTINGESKHAGEGYGLYDVRIDGSGTINDINGQYDKNNSYYKLKAAPTAPQFDTPTPAEGSYVTTNSPTIAWKNVPAYAHSVNYIVDGVSYNTVDNSVSGTSVTLTNLSEGTHTIALQSQALSGLKGAAGVTRTFTIDSKAPVVTVTPSTGNGPLHGIVNFNINVTDANLDPSQLSHMNLTFQTGDIYNPSVNPEINKTVDLSSGHATVSVDTTKFHDVNGSGQSSGFEVRVPHFTDLAGNNSMGGTTTSSGPYDMYFRWYAIDNTAPVVTSLTLDKIITDGGVNYTSAALNGGKLRVTFTTNEPIAYGTEMRLEGFPAEYHQSSTPWVYTYYPTGNTNEYYLDIDLTQYRTNSGNGNILNDLNGKFVPNLSLYMRTVDQLGNVGYAYYKNTDNSTYKLTLDNKVPVIDSASIAASDVGRISGTQIYFTSAARNAANGGKLKVSFKTDEKLSAAQVSFAKKNTNGTYSSVTGSYALTSTDGITWTGDLDLNDPSLANGLNRDLILDFYVKDLAGNHYYYLDAFDASGNYSPTDVNTHFINVDNQNPVADIATINGKTYQTGMFVGLDGGSINVAGSVQDIFSLNRVGLQLVQPGVSGQVQYTYANGNLLYNTIGLFNWAGVFSGVDITNLADGTYAINLVPVDMAGNVVTTTYTFNLDKTAPIIKIDGNNPKSVYNLSDGLNVHVIEKNLDYVHLDRIDAQAPNNDKHWDKTGESFGLSWLKDGEYKLTVADKAGNITTATFIVDRTAPTVPVSNMYDANSDAVTNGYITTEDFSFALSSSSDVVRYQLRYTNDITGAAVSSWSPNDISATGHMHTLGEYIDNFTQGEGVHHFSFSACDAAGNCSAFSAPFTVTYDATGPAISANETTFVTAAGVIAPNFTDGDGAISGNTYAWVGEISNPDGDNVMNDATVLNPSFNITKPGSYKFTLTATDPAGNTTTRAFAFTYTEPTPPATNPSDSSQAGANNSGGTTTGGAAANGFTNVTVDGQDATDNTDDGVLGEQDDNTAKKASATSDNGETEGEVKGASDEKGCSKFLGICWYYWIPIVIVVAVLGRWLYGTLRRRGEGNA